MTSEEHAQARVAVKALLTLMDTPDLVLNSLTMQFSGSWITVRFRRGGRGPDSIEAVKGRGGNGYDGPLHDEVLLAGTVDDLRRVVA